MILIEATLDHPLLREAVRAIEDRHVRWVRNMDVDGDQAMLFWVDSEVASQFDGALDADPTVRVDRSIEVGDQRLYQVTLANKGAETDLYPVLDELEGTLLSAERSSDGWHCRLGMPHEEAMDRFFDVVERFDIPFEINRRWELQEIDEAADFGLTEVQLEALLTALESGHFDVPRETSQIEISDTLGISDVAVSQRLRRGMKTLLENTVKNRSSTPRNER